MTGNATYHMAVFIDHDHARIFAVTREEARETATIQAADSGHGHIHHKAGTPGPGHEAPAEAFLRQTAQALQGAHRLLIAGPAQAKTALKSFLDTHEPQLAAKVIDVIALAHPGDFHAAVWPHFLRADRMAG